MEPNSEDTKDGSGNPAEPPAEPRPIVPTLLRIGGIGVWVITALTVLWLGSIFTMRMGSLERTPSGYLHFAWQTIIAPFVGFFLYGRMLPITILLVGAFIGAVMITGGAGMAKKPIPQPRS